MCETFSENGKRHGGGPEWAAVSSERNLCGRGTFKMMKLMEISKRAWLPRKWL